MPIKADLNTTPYYDDFDEDKEFYRVLFRPGHAIQARELTTLQTYLQNQVEKFGMHMFEEGAMVIPGQISLDVEYNAVKLQATYSSNSVESYRTDYVGTVITGETSGVKAKVVGSVAATSTDPLTLYVKYEDSGTDNATLVFANAENISSNGTIGTFTGGTLTATTETTNACPIGSSVNIAEGVFFTRGHFVKNQTETLILDKYTNEPSYRIGFDITESFQTPEGDTSLLDNATGVSNFAAKGAHRLAIKLTLAKRELTSVEDSDFIELMRVENGIILTKVQHTNYALLENTLARRTYDESGDYTVENFSIEAHEHLLDGDNLGIYTSSAGGDSTKLAIGLSPGKAYVKGFEIETLSTQYVNIDKARDIDTVNNSVSPASLGNYLNVTNTFGTPDITMIGTDSIPFNIVNLYDTPNTTAGGINGALIGQARCRAFEHISGDLANRQGTPTHGASGTHGTYRLYLFDVQMYISLQMTATSTYTNGAKLTGLTSGAYGYVVSATATSAGPWKLIQTSGSFISGETLISSVAGDTQTSVISAADFNVYDMSSVKQVFMDDPDAGHDFISDVVLDSEVTLKGTAQLNGTTSIIGLNSFFTSELRVGDIISIPTGTGTIEERTIVTIVSDTSITITLAATGTLTGSIIRKRASMREQEELVAVYKLPKSDVKTLLTTSNNGLTDSTLEIRRQFQGTVSNLGNISFTLGSNEVFNSLVASDYSLSILTAGTGAGAGTGIAGDIVDISSGISGTGTATITITDGPVLGTTGATTVKLTTTITRQVGTHKSKTSQKSTKKIITAVSSSNSIYGERISDIDISLGVADVYAVRGIYLSKDVSTVPTTPTLTLTGVSSVTFTSGEKVKGATTGAIGGIVGYTSGTGVLEYYPISGTFGATENITYNSTDTATITAIDEGDKNVTSDFMVDTGQRDSFYDISKIVRKPTAVTPAGQILIVFDYFTHSAGGDFFSVDSYSGQVEYSDIPQYIATRVDPDTLAPSGEYELRDCLDFRSRVSDGTAGGNNFVFSNRSFEKIGSSRFDIPKVDSLVRTDFEFYLNRIDDIYMSSTGSFVVQKGVSAELPESPDDMDDAMKLTTVSIPAYTHKTIDIGIDRVDNRRYTMRDIGKLERRIYNLEYYTSLNMLESDTQSLQIQDANGLDRFKSGFIVDNFSGHSIGDVMHLDYTCSMDMRNGILRPETYQDNIELREWATTDTSRSSLNYVKTGDLLMLPYSHTVLVSQGFASRVENVNPFAVQSWVGVIKLSPGSDTWIDTQKAPDIIIDVEGNYESILARERNRLGTIWGAWRTNWTGNRRTNTTTFRRGNAQIRRTQTIVDRRQIRNGVNTRVIESFEKRLAGTRVINSAVIPWIRTKKVTFNATGLKPNTKVYPFFDGVDVSSHVTSPLVTDIVGKINNAVYTIPVNKFRTGKRTFRLTDRSDNNMVPGIAQTAGEATYTAAGTLNTEQSTYLSIRNAQVIRTNVSDTRAVNNVITNTREQVIRRWGDPLAQTFLVETDGGCFVTKVDLYFQSKDAVLPVNIMIRTVENGIPAKLVLPFSNVSLEPSAVNISDNATAVTTFTFDSPVYLKHLEEYCLVIYTNSNDYKVWISQVGEKEINSTRTISEQPYMGVLFKSQNASSWTASQMEDLKFTMYKAKFDTAVTGKVKLINEEISTGNTDFSGYDAFTLVNNPLSTESGVAKVRVFHENHGMHSTSSNVTITGVVAPTGETGTLSSIPLAEINKDHTSISDIEVDSYCVSTTQAANNSIAAGGDAIIATRDIPFDLIHPIISVMDFPKTSVGVNIQTTTGQSLAGAEIAYSKVPEVSAPSITLNEDYVFTTPRLIASKKNETANLNGADSLDLNIQLETSDENVSPVIDTERTSIVTVSNRIDKIDSAADIGTAHTYVPSTEADGDNNPAIYMTRKISLEVPATALRTMLAAVVQSSSGIEVYYKTLRTDTNTNFDDIGWVSYNNNGSPDITPSTSKDETDYKDYLYTVDSLPEFIAFSIKIVMKSSNSTIVPLIKDFRAIALAL